MSELWASLEPLVPALAFLCAAVPLAELLDELGFFGSVAAVIERRHERIPVAALWWVAAATTAVLNLDTTIVLLTPLYVRLARASDHDPLGLALVPLLLASFASSILPVSNLTTLVVAERFDLDAMSVLVHLGPVSAAACIAGWWGYRRHHPTTLSGSSGSPVDRRALRIGSAIISGLLVGFVLGPAWGVRPWVVALAADVVLAAVTRRAPWRSIPWGTAAAVAAVATIVAAVVPPDLLTGLLGATSPLGLLAVSGAATGAANAVNNLPATFVALDASSTMTPGMWAWLAGVNTGAVLLPMGALANLLWWRIVTDEGVDLDLRRYVRSVLPVAVPALVASAAALALCSLSW